MSLPTEPIGASAPAPRFLRLSAGFVYFYFGMLKFYTDLSQAELLASQTIMRLLPFQVSADTVLLWLASAEVLIGLAFLFNIGLRWVLWIFLAHQIGTFSPLFVMPEITFKIAPFSPTLEGQYIIKNVVSLAAGITVMLPAVRSTSRRRTEEKLSKLQRPSATISASPSTEVVNPRETAETPATEPIFAGGER